MSGEHVTEFENFIKTGVYLRAWSHHTVNTVQRTFACFLRFQQSQRDRTGTPTEAPNISKAQLEAWVIWMRQNGYTNGGVNVKIRHFNSFTSWLKEEGHLSEAIRLKLLPNTSKPLRGFSDNEIRSLLSFRPKSFIELRTWTLICLLLDTGCRIEEILSVYSTDCDLDQLTITVNGKGSKKRRVPVSLELRKTLFRYNQRKMKCSFNGVHVFCTRNGSRLMYRNIYRDIKALCAKAGVVGEHVHPHSLRHFFAVTYIRRGGDIYRLSRILGHTSISTTQLYLRSMGMDIIGENHSSLSPLSR